MNAIEWNKKRGPKSFMCPVRHVMVNPGSAQGVADTAVYQRAFGLEDDGLFGRKTRAAFFRFYGAFSETATTRHPLPLFFRPWGGYHHAGTWEDADWPHTDKQFQALTEVDEDSEAAWIAAMLRLVAGWKPGRETFSRGLDSWISLDTYSIGIAHWWADTAPDLLEKIVRACPELAAFAWGSRLANNLRSADWTRSTYRPVRGHTPHNPKLNALCAGWRAIARHEDVVELVFREWLSNYAGDAEDLCNDIGWGRHLGSSEGGQILAAVARLCNSRGKGGARRMIHRAAKQRQDVKPMRVLRHLYRSEALYNKPKRWKKITEWRGFKGPAPKINDRAALDRQINALRWGCG